MRFSRRAALTVIVLATSSVAAQAQGTYNPNAYLMSQGAYLGPGYAGAPLNPTLAPLVAAQQAQLAQQQQALAAQQQMQLGQPTQGASSQQSPGVSGTGGTANTVIVTDPRNPDLSRYSPDSYGDKARVDLVGKAARGAGIRAGFAEEMDRITAVLADPELRAELDRRWDFTEVVSGDIVPPVIAEAHDITETTGDRRLILTLGSFEILRPARLSTRPPNWRDYLIVEAYSAPAPAAVAPHNAAEQTAWDGEYGPAKEIGIREARATFAENVNRLDRDLSGMQRYHELAARGALSLPVVSAKTTKLRISDQGRRADIGERIVELRVTPSFKAAAPAAYR